MNHPESSSPCVECDDEPKIIRFPPQTRQTKPKGGELGSPEHSSAALNLPAVWFYRQAIEHYAAIHSSHQLQRLSLKLMHEIWLVQNQCFVYGVPYEDLGCYEFTCPFEAANKRLSSAWCDHARRLCQILEDLKTRFKEYRPERVAVWRDWNPTQITELAAMARFGHSNWESVVVR